MSVSKRKSKKNKKKSCHKIFGLKRYFHGHQKGLSNASGKARQVCLKDHNRYLRNKRANKKTPKQAYEPNISESAKQVLSLANKRAQYHSGHFEKKRRKLGKRKPLPEFNPRTDENQVDVGYLAIGGVPDLKNDYRKRDSFNMKKGTAATDYCERDVNDVDDHYQKTLKHDVANHKENDEHCKKETVIHVLKNKKKESSFIIQLKLLIDSFFLIMKPCMNCLKFQDESAINNQIFHRIPALDLLVFPVNVDEIPDDNHSVNGLSLRNIQTNLPNQVNLRRYRDTRIQIYVYFFFQRLRRQQGNNAVVRLPIRPRLQPAVAQGLPNIFDGQMVNLHQAVAQESTNAGSVLVLPERTVSLDHLHDAPTNPVCAMGHERCTGHGNNVP